MSGGVYSESASTTIRFGPGTKVGELMSALSRVPATAVIRVEHFKGDQRESPETTITATWNLPANPAN